jgi:predicted NAD/FAD-binding protein
MRIAIVGGGISGLVSAWLLQHDHEVTLHEASAWLGGHARSIPVRFGNRTVYAECGFKYFFDDSYPTLVALVRALGLELRRFKGPLSLTRPGRDVLVLPPRSLRHVRRLLSWQALRELVGFYGFLRGGLDLLAAGDWSVTLREYAERRAYTAGIAEGFLYPFLAASWGAPVDVMRDFPAYDVLKVLRRGKGEGPAFYEFCGGSSAYIGAIVAELDRVRLRVGVGVDALARRDGRWEVRDTDGGVASYDRVVVATSAPNALSLLAPVAEGARQAEALRSFRHFDTHIVIHRDPRLMPASPGDWGLLNVFVEGDKAWATEWSGYTERLPVFRTWLPRGYALPRDVVHEERFRHLVVTTESPALHRRIADLQGSEGLYLAGMYTTDVDNHESALRSAHAVGRALAPHAPNLARFAVKSSPWERPPA